jgi:surface antigen
MADKYHALMIDAAGITKAIEQLDSEDDVGAIEAARRALARSPHYVAAEIWSGRERIGKVLGTKMALERWTTRH